MNERYEIRRKIGQGGLGTVYQAFDSQLKRDVAVKRLFAPVDAAGNIDRDSTAEKLMREATALSRLNHPNIVSVFDVGVDADGGYVVMELLKGETLTETIAKGTLTLRDFHQVVLQTLEALIAAEAQNILHRDLKPSNIMVIWLPSGRFLIKILDFGLAKVSAQPALQTIDQNNSVLGSIFYMAPEQFERKELDFSTDLYSLGSIYYFCLAGKDPFTGRSVADVMNAHLEHRVIPLHEVRPDLPSQVADWVMWLLRRDMKQRPATAKIALNNFPLVESSGGAVQVDPDRRFVIPQLVEPGGAPSGPAPAPAPRPASSPAGSPVSSHPTSSSSSIPARTTSATRIPPTSSGPVRTTTSTRLSTGTVPTRTGPTPPHLQPSLGHTPGRSRTVFLSFSVGGVILALLAGLLTLNSRGGKEKALPPDALVSSLTLASRNSVAQGDEIQFSFQVKHQSGQYFRFALIEPDSGNSQNCRGYAFDIEEREPVSLSIRRYSGEPAANVRQIPIPSGPFFTPKLEGRNVPVSRVTKVELRGKLTAPNTMALTVTLWGAAGEKGVYQATDSSSPITGVQEYGFRGIRAVVDQVTDKKLTVAKAPKPKPPGPSGPTVTALSDPGAFGLAVLLDDNFDTGKTPSLGDDPDDPDDLRWEESPWLAKPDKAKKINNINGSNALAINSNRSSYVRFAKVQLSEKRLIEAAFSCRTEDSIDAIRLMLVDKTTESRGYLVEIARNVRITLHELRGQNAKDFPLEVCRQLCEGSIPNPPVRLSQVSQIRLSVMRTKGEETKVQITATLPGGKTTVTSFTDPQGAYHFTAFGLKTRGKKGKILLDDIRIVSSAAPAG